MYSFNEVGAGAFIALIAGTILAIVLPVLLAVFWLKLKKEKISSVIIGAATFLVFALLLEKSLLSLIIGIDHPLSRFLNANPLLFSLIAGLFPGIFEETGRLVAFKFLLKKNTNKETAISYGIGHGGIEVIMLLGITYINYIIYAVMINAGVFIKIIDQVAAQAPDQVEALCTLASQLSTIALPDVGMAMIERVFAVLFHIGASMLVFYAVRDRKKFWLYPLAIFIHTAMDFIAGLYSTHAIKISVLGLECIFAAFGLITFFAAYFLLYKKDKN